MRKVVKAHAAAVAIVILAQIYPLQAQSLFKFVGKGVELQVERTITVNAIYQNLAREVLLARGIGIENIRVISQTTLQATYNPGILTPAVVFGPNSYLKGVNRAFKGAAEWKAVNIGTGYNGAHHIVTKFVITQIGGSEEAIRNGPSVFHPLHNKPEYVDAFHNHQRQLELYKTGGIKGIVTDFFERVPGFTEDEVKIMLLESELWSKHWGFKWQ